MQLCCYRSLFYSETSEWSSGIDIFSIHVHVFPPRLDWSPVPQHILDSTGCPQDCKCPASHYDAAQHGTGPSPSCLVPLPHGWAQPRFRLQWNCGWLEASLPPSLPLVVFNKWRPTEWTISSAYGSTYSSCCGLYPDIQSLLEGATVSRILIEAPWRPQITTMETIAHEHTREWLCMWQHA